MVHAHASFLARNALCLQLSCGVHRANHQTTNARPSLNHDWGEAMRDQRSRVNLPFPSSHALLYAIPSSLGHEHQGRMPGHEVQKGRCSCKGNFCWSNVDLGDT